MGTHHYLHDHPDQNQRPYVPSISTTAPNHQLHSSTTTRAIIANTNSDHITQNNPIPFSSNSLTNTVPPSPVPPPSYDLEAHWWVPLRYASAVAPVLVPPPSQPPPPPPPLPPYVDHNHAKKIKNDVNVHKDSVRLVVDEKNLDSHLVSFAFDALVDGR
ncbi:hypothetical protein GH714_042237 [Hevea brasiliensis]|uniref:MGRN1/RNF157-like N-terminal domain-containing protein n=1 Tax=Hevea brasiliensis TaxID=3981 RepID=A0A6A6MX21_HEVBR|nr:hypothetical protein GH714_042237 [Hevea brasiliensis]